MEAIRRDKSYVHVWEGVYGKTKMQETRKATPGERVDPKGGGKDPNKKGQQDKGTSPTQERPTSTGGKGGKNDTPPPQDKSGADPVNKNTKGDKGKGGKRDRSQGAGSRSGKGQQERAPSASPMRKPAHESGWYEYTSADKRWARKGTVSANECGHPGRSEWENGEEWLPLCCVPHNLNSCRYDNKQCPYHHIFLPYKIVQALLTNPKFKKFANQADNSYWSDFSDTPWDKAWQVRGTAPTTNSEARSEGGQSRDSGGAASRSSSAAGGARGKGKKGKGKGDAAGTAKDKDGKGADDKSSTGSAESKKTATPSEPASPRCVEVPDLIWPAAVCPAQKKGKECNYSAVNNGLKCPYQHFDTEKAWYNELCRLNKKEDVDKHYGYK